MRLVAREGLIAPRLIAILAVVASFAMGHQAWLITRFSSDPDRFYHLMLAREWAASAGLFLKSLPSVDALGWAGFFPDKEPLFHVLTGLLQKAGGESAVLLLPALLGVLLLLILARLIQTHSGVRSFCGAFLLATIALILEPWLFQRTSMLRPHGLAMVLFFTLLLQVQRRSLIGTLIASTAFALAYHAVYLPLTVLLAALVIERDSKHWRLLGSGVLGLLIGILGSPSFPGNVIMGWRHLQIALFEAPDANLNFGIELYPWATNQFLVHHLGTFMALSLGVREMLANPSFARGHRLLLSLCGIFLVLSMQSPRAQEYLFPLVIILAGSLFARWIGVRERRASLLFLGASLLVPALVTTGPKAWHVSDSAAQPTEQTRLFEALKGLPENRPRIFNMEWDASPQVLYARPEARVVDLLDPSFLAQHDRGLHEARQAIADGRMVDVSGFLVHQWQADYLLTRNDLLRRRLEQDPHFERIHPRKLSGVVGEFALYRVNRGARRHFISTLENVRGARELPVDRFGALGAGSPEFHDLPAQSEHEAAKIEFQPVYHDLFRRFVAERESATQEDRERTMRCASARIPSGELARLQGRTLLAIGGGRNIRMWRNGRPLYHSIQVPSERVMSSQLIQLPEPVAASDAFEVLVCSLETASVMGISLSFWSEVELASLCERKGWSPPETLEDRRGWKVVGRPRFSCIGNFAMPALQSR